VNERTHQSNNPIAHVALNVMSPRGSFFPANFQSFNESNQETRIERNAPKQKKIVNRVNENSINQSTYDMDKYVWGKNRVAAHQTKSKVSEKKEKGESQSEKSLMSNIRTRFVPICAETLLETARLPLTRLLPRETTVQSIQTKQD
jgi:hypothetical protein